MHKLISRFIKDFKVGALIWLVGAAILSSCATSPDDAAKKIEDGMTKADIIELMGNPDHADRVYGSDRWIYDAQGGRTKPVEIYFTEGKVTLSGPPAPPMKDIPVKKGSFKEVPAEKGFKPVPVEKAPAGATAPGAAAGAAIPPKAAGQ